ncbi:hypothetical protein Glove_212g176 [Diversispora epigaea]|uniref:Uncharacterized protein n=1 Tax=Diversispora epigaea TaxID=1348612 RepID=A0A397ISL3_9GLOM|nr:hypothetical protein Glove_212g176 [Diversispora epigaea]
MQYFHYISLFSSYSTKKSIPQSFILHNNSQRIQFFSCSVSSFTPKTHHHHHHHHHHHQNNHQKNLHIQQRIRNLLNPKLNIIKFPSDSCDNNNKDNNKDNNNKDNKDNNKDNKDKEDNNKDNNKDNKIIVKCEQIPLRSIKKITFQDIILETKRNIINTFMPKGYPESVTKDYWEFTKWQLIQNISGSVTGVLSTQSLLFAMGLGNKSIPLAAALNWIIKDGLGQFGGVIYAAFINNRFDSEPKRHRFQSVVAMQLAALLELFTPLFPGMFLFIASISNIGKNIAWLAGSATRAQINKTFALRDNLGDIAGKTGSLATTAGLIGTALGVIISATMTSITSSLIPNIEQLSSVLSSPMTPIFLSFIPISIFSIYCNYRSNLHVTTNTLNIPRTEMILHDVLNGYYSSSKDYFFSKDNFYREGKEEEISESPLDLPQPPQQQSPIINKLNELNKFKNLISTPKNISTREIFVKKYHSPFKIPLIIEPDLDNYIILKEKQHKNNNNYEINLYNCLKQMGFLCPEEYYIFVPPSPTTTTTNNNNIANSDTTTTTTINIHPSSHISENNSSQQNEKHHMAIWFSQNAKSKDIIKGFYHACVIRYILEHEKSLVMDSSFTRDYSFDEDSLSKDSNSQNYSSLNIVRETHEWVNNSFDIFVNELVEKKWDIEHHFLENISHSKVDGNRLFVEFK